MTDDVQTAGTLGSRYLLHESLGRGGMGDVYRATLRTGDPDAEFAAKVLRPEFSADPQVVARFLQERTILTTLRDEHLVRIHDLVLDNDTLAIVMEYVKGGDLRKHLRARTVLSPGEAVDIVTQLLRGLAAAHDVGIVHRDVKPENVLLDTHGPTRVVKLADFGISRMAHGQTLTRMTSLIGSPEYMAPELAEHEHAAPPADIYAAGIVLYELLAGRTPFAGGHPVAVLRRHLDMAPPPIVGLDPGLWELIERLLAKRPQDRPARADAVAEKLRELRPLLNGIPALPPMPAPQVPDATETSMTRVRSTPAAQPSGDPSEAPTSLRIATPSRRAHPGGGTPRRGRRRAAAVGAVVAVVALAAAAGAWVLRPASSVAETSPEPVALALAPSVVGDGVVEQRNWRLSTASSGNFTEDVTLSNSGSAAADSTYDLVIPKEIAASASDITFSPTPESVVEDDPVVRYRVTLDPGESLALHYTTTVRWEGSAQDALAAWATALRTAVAAYRESIDAAEQVTLSKLTLKPRSITLDVGSNRQLTLTGKMSDGTAAESSILAEPIWTSGDPAVAEVTDSGQVFALAPGQATVTVSVGGVSATSVVAVPATDPTSPPTITQPPTSSPPESDVATPRATTAKPAPKATTRPPSTPKPTTPKPTTPKPTTPKPTTASPTPRPTSSSPTPPPDKKKGDINGDGLVDDTDKDILLSDWQTSASRSDLNDDGIVDISDLSILLSNWG